MDQVPGEPLAVQLSGLLREVAELLGRHPAVSGAAQGMSLPAAGLAPRNPRSWVGSPAFQVGELSARTGVSPERLGVLYRFTAGDYPELRLDGRVAADFSSAQVRRDICVLTLMARQLVGIESGGVTRVLLASIRHECTRLGFPDQEFNLLRDLTTVTGLRVSTPAKTVTLAWHRHRDQPGVLTAAARSTCTRAAERMAPLGARGS